MSASQQSNGQPNRQLSHNAEGNHAIHDLQNKGGVKVGFEQLKAELERLYGVKDQLRKDLDALDREVVELLLHYRTQLQALQVLREAVSWFRAGGPVE